VATKTDRVERRRTTPATASVASRASLRDGEGPPDLPLLEATLMIVSPSAGSRRRPEATPSKAHPTKPLRKEVVTAGLVRRLVAGQPAAARPSLPRARGLLPVRVRNALWAVE